MTSHPNSPPPPAFPLSVLDSFTTGDPVLERMRTAAADFGAEVTLRRAPRWLLLWGSVGTGKTMLASLLYDSLRHGFRSIPGPRTVKWPLFMQAFQAHRPIDSKLEEYRTCPLLFIDDIGAELMTVATLAKLSALLDSRLGKWTLLTTNLSPDVWREREDRIASRFFRGGNQVVNCSTTDYSLRKRRS